MCLYNKAYTRRHLDVNKTKAIVVLVIMAIFLTLMITFAVVDFPIGNTVYDYTGYAKTISLGMDLSGGIEAVYLVTDTGDNLEQRISGTVSSMQSLLIEKGYTEAVVSTSEINNNHYITVQVPNIDDPERLLNLIGRPASLEFRSSQDESAIVLISGKEHLDNAYVTVDSDGFTARCITTPLRRLMRWTVAMARANSRITTTLPICSVPMPASTWTS